MLMVMESPRTPIERCLGFHSSLENKLKNGLHIQTNFYIYQWNTLLIILKIQPYVQRI
jgi:hypothetical protein